MRRKCVAKSKREGSSECAYGNAFKAVNPFPTLIALTANIDDAYTDTYQHAHIYQDTPVYKRLHSAAHTCNTRT